MINIFIGYDNRERAATNVLIDSLNQRSSLPISINILKNNQLINSGIYWRKRDPKQSTDFSFTRFLVPYLMNFDGWAIFMDCDMLCQDDIAELWNQRNENYSLMCVKHKHKPKNKTKFLGEPQTSYPKKNWSSLMLINCSKCKNLTVEYVNSASGLDLHRFNWLDNDNEIGEIKGTWNYLVQDPKKSNSNASLIHWTLGGPWFKEQRDYEDILTDKWFNAREESMRLYDDD
tara:strand:- start:84 stop:776 length:693 start_codon:yes stop_codon:yes gene_type:complete